MTSLAIILIIGLKNALVTIGAELIILYTQSGINSHNKGETIQKSFLFNIYLLM